MAKWNSRRIPCIIQFQLLSRYSVLCAAVLYVLSCTCSEIWLHIFSISILWSVFSSVLASNVDSFSWKLLKMFFKLILLICSPATLNLSPNKQRRPKVSFPRWISIFKLESQKFMCLNMFYIMQNNFILCLDSWHNNSAATAAEKINVAGKISISTTFKKWELETN